MTYKISTTGRLSIFGINSFPVSMFKDQWTQILVDHREDILKVLSDNDSALPLRKDVEVVIKAKRAEARAAKWEATKTARERKKLEKKRQRLLKLLEEMGPQETADV